MRKYLIFFIIFTFTIIFLLNLPNNQNVNEVNLGGSFELIDKNGQIKSNYDIETEYFLIFFGFTTCPSICPIALNNISLALNEISPEILEKITPIFITVDPSRDTPARLKEYFKHFHEKFVPLTGEDEVLSKIIDKFGVYSNLLPESENIEGEYMYDHSSYIYLTGNNGKYIDHSYHNIEVIELINMIEINLK